jgi:phosphohistidine phosphatase
VPLDRGERRAAPRDRRMKVLVIRHAIAEDSLTFAKTGREDGARPLTKEGRAKMREGAAGLVRLVPRLDVLATSPLARAMETAEIVAKAYGPAGPRVAQVAALTPTKPVNALLHWLQGQPAAATVAVVGHEPHLGVFVSWLLTGLQESFVELKKGSACLLEFEQDVKAGRARLLWAMKPSHLRDLGK